MPEFELSDGVVVDDETGEIIEIPAEVGQLEILQREYRDAVEQRDAWDLRRQTAMRALVRYMDDSGETRAATHYAKSSRVQDSTTERAPAENVRKAVQSESLSLTAATDLLVRAAKELDPKEVRAWLVEHDLDKLAPLLIDESPRAGYVRTTIVARPAPEDS